MNTARLHSVTLILLVGAALSLAGCATPGGTGAQQPAPTVTTAVPQPAPDLHHVTAYVPRHTARTAVEAQAEAHVALARAKERAQAELCAGQRVLSGNSAGRVGPLPAAAPEPLGEHPAWFYRASWQPIAHACPGVSTESYHRAVSRHLPEWMTIRTVQAAGEWRQGRLEPTPEAAPERPARGDSLALR